MDRFRELATFVAVAESGAFNAAARTLNLSPPVVTRLISALEQRLGARLLVRTTRRVVLTDAGTRLLADATRVLADLEAAESAAAGAHLSPQGLLRVTAPVLFGQQYVLPILRAFLDATPAVSASTLFVDRVVDLIDEGLDVAVRIGDLADSSLSAQRVGAVRLVVVAAPAYLARQAPPAELEDLARHRVVQARSMAAGTWSFVKDGRRTNVAVQPRLTVNTVAAAVDTAVTGWGVARALSYQVAEALAAGSLVELVPGSDDRELPIHIVHTEGRLSAAKTRAFVDFAAARLRATGDTLLARA